MIHVRRILDKQYFSSQAINGRISTLALHTRSMFNRPADRWDLMRHILAAQKVFYWSLRQSDAANHQYKPTEREHPGTWEALCCAWMLPKNLLTRQECSLLSNYKGNRCNALFAMYEQQLRIAMAEEAEHHTSTGRADYKRAMVEHVLAIKSQMASTFEVPYRMKRSSNARFSSPNLSSPNLSC